MSEFRMPLGDGKDAVLNLDWPITEDQWQQMQAVLAAMKPALVWDEQVPDG